MLQYLWYEEQLSILAAAEQSTEGLHGSQVQEGQLHGMDLRLSSDGRGLVAAGALLMNLLPAPLSSNSSMRRCSEKALVPGSSNRRDLVL